MPTTSNTFRPFTKEPPLRYLLHRPPQDRGGPWPLILFLHGAGERGSNLEVLRRHGIPRVTTEQPDFPFVCVSPQCSSPGGWASSMPSLEALLDHVVDSEPVDPDRVYLTGISMGGAGAWQLGTLAPHRFAAVVPICGYGSPSHGFPARVAALRHTPVWAFHGARDELVPLRETEVLVEALRAAGGSVKLTVYDDASHDSWTRTYADAGLYAWLLGNTRQRGQAPMR